MSKHSKNKMKVFTKEQENFWSNTNKELLDEVINERMLKDSTVTFKIEEETHKQLIDKAIELNCSKSFLLQYLVKTFLRNGAN